jgi:hypothetical protein
MRVKKQLSTIPLQMWKRLKIQLCLASPQIWAIGERRYLQSPFNPAAPSHRKITLSGKMEMPRGQFFLRLRQQ